MVIESQVDRQREHQANERTFLAWLRTSIALIAFGFAIARFGLFIRQLQSTLSPQPMPNPAFLSSETLGVSLVVVGIMMIALAAWNYNRIFQQIERGDYRPSRLLVWIITIVVMVLGVLSIPILLFRGETPSAPPAGRRAADLQRRVQLYSGIPVSKLNRGSRSPRSPIQRLLNRVEQ